MTAATKPDGRTPIKGYRLEPEYTAKVAKIREAIGVRTDTEALRYAITQTERLVRGGKK